MQRVMSACVLRRTCRPNPGLASLYLNTMYSVLRVVDNVSNFYCDATSAIAILSLRHSPVFVLVLSTNTHDTVPNIMIY